MNAAKGSTLCAKETAILYRMINRLADMFPIPEDVQVGLVAKLITSYEYGGSPLTIVAIGFVANYKESTMDFDTLLKVISAMEDPISILREAIDMLGGDTNA